MKFKHIHRQLVEIEGAYPEEKVENKLNEYGAAGWELVSLIMITDPDDGSPIVPYCTFKKQE